MLSKSDMKQFIHRCLVVRIVLAEIGSTLAFAFLIVFGVYAAWQDFVVKLHR